MTTKKATKTAPGPDALSGQEPLLELLQRAEKGDKEVLPRLRAVLDRASGIWRRYADLGAQLEGTLIKTTAGENLVLQESLRRGLEEMKQELGGGREASPLERLLVERVALGWLETHYLDFLEAQNGNLTEKQRAELRKRQDRASSRYLMALKTLAQVRRTLRRASREPGRKGSRRGHPDQALRPHDASAQAARKDP
jgi:hypothetical protein